MNRGMNHISYGIVAALTAGTVSWISADRGQQYDVDTQVLRELAKHVTIEYLDDNSGGLAKTFRFTGVNVQIVNGLGATNGNPSDPFAFRANEVQTNSLGNLILGYDEVSSRPPERTGSHNLVVGTDLGYQSFGGIVTGYKSKLRAPYAVAIGGEAHKVTGPFSVALGGVGHSPEGSHCVAAGGYQHRVTGLNSFSGGGRHSVISGSHATAIGGSHALASGWLGTVVGGTKNESRGIQSVVSGGYRNLASGWRATVNGGENNTASGDFSSVAFGHNRTVNKSNMSGDTDHDGVAGSLWEDD